MDNNYAGSFEEMCGKQALEHGVAEMQFANWKREHPWMWGYLRAKGLIYGCFHPGY